MSTEIIVHDHVTWTNITNPTRDDMARLHNRYPFFHKLNIQDCLSDLEFPKVDPHEEYLFLVLHLPQWDANEKISRPSEVDIFVADGALVTIHNNGLNPISELFARAEEEENQAELLGGGASPLLYEVVNALIQYCFPILAKVNQNIRHVEEHLFNKDTGHILRDIAIVRRDVIALRHILRPQSNVIDGLHQGDWPFMQSDLRLYWSNLGDHLDQLLAMLDEHVDVINGLSDTVDTLASHRIDGVVRVLTFITILTAPLTLLATVFGINVDLLPAEFHPHLFLSVNIVGVVLTLLLVIYLYRKGWL